MLDESGDSDSSSQETVEDLEVIQDGVEENLEEDSQDQLYPRIENLDLDETITANDNREQRPFIDQKIYLKDKDEMESVGPSMTLEEIKKRVSRMKKGSKTNYNRNVNKKGKKSVTADGFW